jgi:hypothetical protein
MCILHTSLLHDGRAQQKRIVFGLGLLIMHDARSDRNIANRLYPAYVTKLISKWLLSGAGFLTDFNILQVATACSQIQFSKWEKIFATTYPALGPHTPQKKKKSEPLMSQPSSGTRASSSRPCPNSPLLVKRGNKEAQCHESNA